MAGFLMAELFDHPATDPRGLLVDCLAPRPDAPFAVTGPDLSGLGDLLNLSRQEVLDALFDAALDSFDLALPDVGFGDDDHGGRWVTLEDGRHVFIRGGRVLATRGQIGGGAPTPAHDAALPRQDVTPPPPAEMGRRLGDAVRGVEGPDESQYRFVLRDRRGADVVAGRLRQAGWDVVAVNRDYGFVKAFPLQKRDTPAVAYHVVPRESLPSVLAHGLLPGSAERSTKELSQAHGVGKVFLTEDRAAAEKWKGQFGGDLAVLRVDLSGVKAQAYRDMAANPDHPRGDPGSFYFLGQAVPPSALTEVDGPDAPFYSPGQPREPAGQPGGGEWTSGGGGGGATPTRQEARAAGRAARVAARQARDAAYRLPLGRDFRPLKDLADALARDYRLAPGKPYPGAEDKKTFADKAADARALRVAAARAAADNAMVEVDQGAGESPDRELIGLLRRTAALALKAERGYGAAARYNARHAPGGPADAPFYSPDQPRDELGRWTTGGGTAAGAGSPEDRLKAAAAMRGEIAEYAKLGISPVEANQGDCSTAAREAIKAIRAAGGEAAYGVPENNLGHVWVVAGGRHYDVQAPDGVDDPKDLPFFQEEPDLIEGGWRSTADDRFGRVPALSATNRAGGVGRSPAEHAAARAAASDAVRAFAAGQGTATTAEAEALAGHLARLTVAQIHTLKAEHGLRGSAPNKAALVAKMAQRFAAWRAGRAPKEAVPDWPEDYDIFGKRDVFADEPHDAGTLAPTASAPERVKPSAVDTPAQAVLNDARAHKAAAWKRVKALREQIRKEPVGGNRSRLRLDLMKAESAHHEAKMLEQKALAAIEARAQELGQTTKAAPPPPAPPPAPAGVEGGTRRYESFLRQHDSSVVPSTMNRHLPGGEVLVDVRGSDADAIQSSYAHEMGHKIHDYLMSPDQRSEWAQIARDAHESLKAAGRGARRGITGNPEEDFPEAFAAWVSGDEWQHRPQDKKGGGLPDTYRDFLTEHFGEPKRLDVPPQLQGRPEPDTSVERDRTGRRVRPQ